MYHKTQGIVLNTINYNDKYLLASVYTDQFGRVTYMVPKSKGKSSKIKKSLFSPLALLEMETEHQASRDIQRIREVQIISPLYSISGNMIKTSVALFLSEFLSRVLKDTDEYPIIFQYLKDSIQILEESEKGLANFHLVFVLKLTRFLGFYPNLENYINGSYFDMLNGVFVDRQPLHNHYVNKTDSKALSLLSRITYENMHYFKFSRQERRNIIDRMIEYYRIHLHNFQDLKSLDILQELF
ncbi:MAG TPA: DNA repair protein RecO [Dysgonomonas sp.]|nr:DNA repair protein RecO [Dysgonomonas sp.]